MQYLVEDDINSTGLPQVMDEIVNGAVTRTYTYGLQRISENLSPSVTGNAAWTPSFYGYDGFGTVRQLTNSAGVVTDSYEYDAFGNSFTKQGTTPNNYLYRGEQYDSDLGLYYLRARYYNPATGRFMSRDPEDGVAHDPASLHKYLYANGDPVNRIDPKGRSTIGEFLGVVWNSFRVYFVEKRGLCWALGFLAAYEWSLSGHVGNDPVLVALLNDIAAWSGFLGGYVGQYGSQSE
jgi:RHS repeat-associated protein